MIELNGKYASAKVFTDVVDNESISQVINLLNQPYVASSRVRMMPDIHAGAGCTIGTTMTISDKICPNLVGVDIGCFTGDTQVWKMSGCYQTLASLAEQGKSFLVESFDEEQRCFVACEAIAHKTRSNAELVRVTYETPYRTCSVRCTPDHKFLTTDAPYTNYSESNQSWVEAKDLVSGQHLVADDAFVYVLSVEPLEEREDVFCLTVDEMHNFMISGGVVVHNCGMETIRIREKHIEMQQLDKLIREKIPSGFSIRSKPHRYADCVDLNQLHCAKHVNLDRAEKSIGTLGGGNHFIEANRDDEGNIYIVVHSGSRHLGLEIANYYQEAGYNALTTYSKEDIDNLIAELKMADKQSEIQSTLKHMKAKHTSVPKQLAYVEGELLDQYLHDMKIAQQFAMLNRKAMIDEIVKGLGVHAVEQFATVHNYIDTENMILRKGAVSAQAGEKLLIPINMRDGSLVCVGKGNEDWNCSAPHGAGRLMSRSAAKETFTVSEFKKQMEGIYTTSVGRSTLDECPMAYKRIEDILDNIGPTVDIVSIIKPIYNFKAGDEA